ncbi:hypothetical protein GCM10009533_58670 [Saccharopolyspora spinosporotrichia]|uniref:Secreted protein n=1 Tax=Saccharopolyspora erythraea TaxID=1836 RepID=A0ABN1DUM0_SACER
MAGVAALSWAVTWRGSLGVLAAQPVSASDAVMQVAARRRNEDLPVLRARGVRCGAASSIPDVGVVVWVGANFQLDIGGGVRGRGLVRSVGGVSGGRGRVRGSPVRVR